jgi:hypothetical protein
MRPGRYDLRPVRGTYEPCGVPAEALEAVFAAGELPGELRDDDVDPSTSLRTGFGGDGGEIGGGKREEGGEGVGVGVEEGVVAVLVGLGGGGVEDGLGFPEAGEGAVPDSRREGWLVIPAEAGIPGGRARSGSRWGPGLRVPIKVIL